MIQNSIQNVFPFQENVTRKRTLEELNMMDAFLFDATTEKLEDATKIAKIIVKRVTGYDINNFTTIV